MPSTAALRYLVLAVAATLALVPTHKTPPSSMPCLLGVARTKATPCQFAAVKLEAHRPAL